ncbi:MAG: MFS transporter [Candidatus Rokubacteria bacterium]|nr:MFS transporter [Candidatus Rokubacteria bacterium]
MTSSYRWVVLGLTVVGFMQTHLHRFAFASLIPTFVADLGLSYAAAGTIQTAYFWTYTLVQVPIGMMADRWGSRRVMVACMGVLAAGALAFAASRTYVEAIGARMLVGLGAAAVWVPGMRLVSEWFPPAERGRATGLMSAGGGIGGTLGLVLVPWLAGFLGWRTAYAALSVPAILTVLLLAVFLRSRGGGAVAHAADGRLGRVLASRALWPFNVSVCCSFGGYFSFLTFLPAFLVKDMRFTPAEAGFTTSLITAGAILSWPLAGVLSDRLGVRKPLVLASQAVSVLACLAFAWPLPALPPAAAMVAALATGLLIGGTILPFVMIAELFPHDLAATAAGVANSACFVGGMVLPILLGRVVDVTGSFAPAFVVAALVQLAALVAAWFVTETGPRRVTA